MASTNVKGVSELQSFVDGNETQNVTGHARMMKAPLFAAITRSRTVQPDPRWTDLRLCVLP